MDKNCTIKIIGDQIHQKELFGDQVCKMKIVEESKV